MKKLYITIAYWFIALNICSIANDTNKSLTIGFDASTLAREFDGEWNMLTLKGKDISSRERAFLLFNFSDSTFYGNNGCNFINGKFHISKTNNIQFTDIISTMMECHNETSERNIMKALNEVSSFDFSVKDGIKHLTLHNAKGQNLFQLKSQNINFINGAWTVSSINNENITANNVHIVIDVQEMRIHGNSGCNLFNGTLFIDPYKDWGVEFQELISTRKMCRDIYIETALLVALEETQFCKEIDNEEIALLDGNGKQLATLKRLKLK
ncbi:MAG: META domain-containing protein [Bacteroidales bacterium]|nr:META domain-containing protein [Bacteroidales bacterium]